MRERGGAFRWVMENSTLKMTNYCVLLMLADFVDSGESGMAWPSHDTLAKRAHCSVRTVRNALAEAEGAGEIQRLGTSESGTVIWQLTAEDLALPSGGSAKSVEGSADFADKVVVASSAQLGLLQEEQPFTLKVQGDSGSVPPSSVAGKRIRPDEWHMAVTLLQRFNELAGKKWEPRTTTGDHNPKVTQIIMRIRENPEITLEEHLAILDRNFKAPWWDGEPSTVGVIYNPETFPRAVVCTGVTKRPATARSSHYARVTEKGGPGW